MKYRNGSSYITAAIFAAAVTTAPAAQATPAVGVTVTWTPAAAVFPYVAAVAVVAMAVAHNQEEVKRTTFKSTAEFFERNAEEVKTYVDERVAQPVVDTYESTKNDLQEVTIENAPEKAADAVKHVDKQIKNTLKRIFTL